MNDSDKQRFRELMEEAGAAYSQDISGKLHPYWRVLSARMDIATLAGALDAHMSDPVRGRFFPLPADLIAACEATKGAHPSADEAWAIALDSYDEAATVVITQQILEARSVAMPIMEEGDKIGARMAFRAAYERLMTQCRGQLPQWTISAGHDPEQRACAIERAVSAGRISRESAKHLLPAPTQASGPIAGLLKGNVVEFPGAADRGTRERIRDLRDIIVRAKPQEREQPMTHAQSEQMKADALAKLASLEAKHSA